MALMVANRGGSGIAVSHCQDPYLLLQSTILDSNLQVNLFPAVSSQCPVIDVRGHVVALCSDSLTATSYRQQIYELIIKKT